MPPVGFWRRSGIRYSRRNNGSSRNGFPATVDSGNSRHMLGTGAARRSNGKRDKRAEDEVQGHDDPGCSCCSPLSVRSNPSAAILTAKSGSQDRCRTRISHRHSQYLIGYHPSNTEKNGKWRKIHVKVNPPKGLPSLSVGSKTGYYAPALNAGQ